jgi:hypothetical protein
VKKLTIDVVQLMGCVWCVVKSNRLIISSSPVLLLLLCGVGLEQCFKWIGTPHPLHSFFVLFRSFPQAMRGLCGFSSRHRAGRFGTFAIKLLWNIPFLISRLIVCSKLYYFCSNGVPCSRLRTWLRWRSWKNYFASFIKTPDLLQLQDLPPLFKMLLCLSLLLLSLSQVLR